MSHPSPSEPPTQNLVCIIRFSLRCELSNTIFTGFEAGLCEYRRIQALRAAASLTTETRDVIWEMELNSQHYSQDYRQRGSHEEPDVCGTEFLYSVQDDN